MPRGKVEDTDFKIGSGTDLTIPLRSLISIIGAVAVTVIGYFHIDERIMLLEHEQVRLRDNLVKNSTWIDEWESGGMLPLDVEQNMRIQFLEEKINTLIRSSEKGRK